MTKFRANDRHPDDDRILIIQDIGDFKLWHERSKLNIHGIICDYAAPIKTLEEAAQHIIKVSSEAALDSDNCLKLLTPMPPPNAPDYIANSMWYTLNKDKNITSELANKVSFLDALKNDGLNGAEQDILHNLASIFAITRDKKSPEQQKIDLSLRVNSAHPEEFHPHELADDQKPGDKDTLSFTFTGKGTMSTSGKDGHTATDKIIETTAGQIFLLDHTIWHKAPPPEEDFNTAPRVNMIMVPQS